MEQRRQSGYNYVGENINIISISLAHHSHHMSVPHQSDNSASELFDMLDSEIMGTLKNDALQKLNSDDFHRQLRNELIMIPIPKILSTEYNEEAPLSQGHYLNMALERVSCCKITLLASLAENRPLVG